MTTWTLIIWLYGNASNPTISRIDGFPTDDGCEMFGQKVHDVLKAKMEVTWTCVGPIAPLAPAAPRPEGKEKP